MVNDLKTHEHGTLVVYLVNVGLYVLRFWVLMKLCEFV
jgi:hypothetical protein